MANRSPPRPAQQAHVTEPACSEEPSAAAGVLVTRHLCLHIRPVLSVACCVLTGSSLLDGPAIVRLCLHIRPTVSVTCCVLTGSPLLHGPAIVRLCLIVWIQQSCSGGPTSASGACRADAGHSEAAGEMIACKLVMVRLAGRQLGAGRAVSVNMHSLSEAWHAPDSGHQT